MQIEQALDVIIDGLGNGNQMCMWTFDAENYHVKVYDNEDITHCVQLLVDPMLVSHDIQTVCKIWISALEHNKDNRRIALKVIQTLKNLQLEPSF